MNNSFFYPELKEGATGNDVIILQEKLKLLGYYDESVTGSFGENTKKAVERFQRDHELESSGIVDQETWTTLFRLTLDTQPIFKIQSKPTLRLGSTGEDVRELQKRLTDLFYYNGPISGNFDRTLETSVKEFQANNRLTADGIVGRDTWSALDTLYAPLAICEENGDSNTNVDSYTVVKGDTLYSIARKFNVSVEELKKVNGLSSDVIFVGQQLKIPSANDIESKPNEFLYTVVRGDTLWSIARRFHTTVDEIKRLNELSSDNLSIGQILKIPTKYTSYIVVKGDTLWNIARRFNTTVDEIKRLNGLSSDNLSIGQILFIP